MTLADEFNFLFDLHKMVGKFVQKIMPFHHKCLQANQARGIVSIFDLQPDASCCKNSSATERVVSW